MEFVTIKDIMENLQVSKNFIYQRILSEVEYKKVGAVTRVNKEMFISWLMGNATFLRQTVLVPKVELNNYNEEFRKKYPSDVFSDKAEMFAKQRKNLPFRKVKPFNFWKEAERGKLLHPKMLVREGTYNNTETLYRDMFKRGAIRITLSSNKTFFYIPEDVPKDEGILCPAMDEVTEFIGANVKGTKKFGGTIKAEGDSVFLQNLIDILRHHYNIEKSEVNANNFEFMVSKYFEVQI